MTLTAETMVVARPEPERDRWGRYVIPDPHTGERRAWTRATTWASTVADTFGLTKWQLRMAAVGLAQRPDLFAQVATVTDPDQPDAKKLLDRLADQAMEHAGTSRRANLGTALHAFCEQADLGFDVSPPEPWDRDVAAYRATLDAHGVAIDRAHVERIVVLPELGVAGTFDRLVLADGVLSVADIKTGRDLSYSWTEIAIQLALYAHATHIWDPAAKAHEAMPPVDLERALVMHIPVGEGRCDLYVVDIAAGWEMAQVCGTVRDWRKRKDLARPVPKIAPAGSPAPGEGAPPAPTPSRVPAATFPAPRESTATAVGEPTDPTAVSAAVGSEPAHIGDALDRLMAGIPAEGRREWLRARVAKIVEAGGEAFLIGVWPAGVPGFGSDHPHTDAELDAIAEACSAAERQGRLAFPDPDPRAVEAAERVPADDPRAVAVLDLFGRLPVDLQENAAAEAGRRAIPKLSTGAATAQQVAMLSGIVRALADQAHARAELVEAHLAAGAELGASPDALAELVGMTSPAAATEWQADRLGDLVDAIQMGWLDPATLAATDRPLSDLDGKRALTAAGKAAADALGVPAPTSSAAVLADPLLLAAIAAR